MYLNFFRITKCRRSFAKLLETTAKLPSNMKTSEDSEDILDCVIEDILLRVGGYLPLGVSKVD